MLAANKSKNSEITESGKIDLGERRVSKMNFSYIVTIPKQFIKSTPYEEVIAVKIIMLKDGCLKLVPSKARNGEEERDLIQDP